MNMVEARSVNNVKKTTLLCFCLFKFFWCPFIAISNVSLQYNGGLFPDIILLTQCYYHRGTNPFKCHKEVLSLQPMIPLERFDIFPRVCVGCSEGLDAFRIFFLKKCLFI